MTTYDASAVANTVIAYKKGMTLQQGRALRDNPLAMFEGAAGAPRLLGESVARLGNGLPTMTIAADETYTLGFGLASVAASSYLTLSTTDVVAHTYTMTHYTGVVRCKASHAAGASCTATLSLFKNGTLVSTFSTTSGSPQARVVDVTFIAGDVLEWRHRCVPGNGSTVSAVSNTASDAYVQQVPLIRASVV